MKDNRVELRQVRLFKDVCEYIGIDDCTKEQMIQDVILDDGMSYEDILKLDDIDVLQLLLSEIERNANYYLENGRNEFIK